MFQATDNTSCGNVDTRLHPVLRTMPLARFGRSIPTARLTCEDAWRIFGADFSFKNPREDDNTVFDLLRLWPRPSVKLFQPLTILLLECCVLNCKWASQPASSTAHYRYFTRVTSTYGVTSCNVIIDRHHYILRPKNNKIVLAYGCILSLSF